jgi:hypothetical protein
MKTYTSSFKNLLSVVTAFVMTGSLSAQIFSEDFQSGYSTGNLSGQNSWAQGFGATPTPSSTVVDDSGSFYISSVDNSYSILNAGNFGLTATDTIELTFDFRATAASANASFGIGEYSQTSSSNGTPPVFGIQGGIWMVRGWGFGTTVLARANSGPVTGDTIAANVNDWYRVRSTWDLSGTGTGTLEIMNLTLGETDFTQLYFNRDQTVSTANLQLDNSFADPVDTWSGVFVRTQGAGVDNLVVVPEPATYALALGLLVLIGVAVRRRFK